MPGFAKTFLYDWDGVDAQCMNTMDDVHTEEEALTSRHSRPNRVVVKYATVVYLR